MLVEKEKPRSLKIMYSIKDEWPQFPVTLQNLMVCWLKKKEANNLDESPQFPVPI